jgi:hypothetical protein
MNSKTKVVLNDRFEKFNHFFGAVFLFEKPSGETSLLVNKLPDTTAKE